MILALVLALQPPDPPTDPNCLLNPRSCRPPVEVDWPALITQQCGEDFVAVSEREAENCRYRVRGAADRLPNRGFLGGEISIPVDAVLGPGDALFDACGITSLAGELGPSRQACALELVAGAVPDDREFLQIERMDASNWFPERGPQCHGIRVEPVWPRDEAGEPIATDEDVVVRIVFDLDEQGRASNVRAGMAERGGLAPSDQIRFLDVSRFAVERWTFCTDRPRAQRRDVEIELVFRRD